MSIKNLKLAKAENAVMSHDWKTAARLYKDLLVGNESNVDYLKALANIYVKSGEDAKAIPYFEQIIVFHPHDVDAMNSLGGIYRRLKRYDESIKVLQKALEERTNIGNVNYNLGFTYKEMGNYEDAIDAFETVIAGNPSDVLAYNHLGSIYFALKEYHKSIMTFKRGLQVDPNHPILNYNLARCYEAEKNYSDAIRCYESALKTRPGWIDAIRDFSELLIKCQKTNQAQDIVEQSIKLHPLDTDLLGLLGKIYLCQNDYDKSINSYKKAEGIKSNDVDILMGLSKALEKNNKIEQALDKIGNAVDLEPENKDVRKQYAHTLLSAQRYDQALDNINELYNDKGDKDLQILDLYGQYFICRGNEEVAKFYYDKIKKLNHHYKEYMLEAADRFVQTGDYENAEKYAHEYVENRPQHPEGYTHLGKIYNAQGKLQSAKKEFEKSISIKKPNVFANLELDKIHAEIAKNPEKYRDDIPENQDNIEDQESVPEENETVNQEEESKPINVIEDEDFDFNSMNGAEIVSEEILTDEDEDFWDNFDDEDEGESFADTLVEKTPEESEELEESDEGANSDEVDEVADSDEPDLMNENNNGETGEEKDFREPFENNDSYQEEEPSDETLPVSTAASKPFEEVKPEVQKSSSLDNLDDFSKNLIEKGLKAQTALNDQAVEAAFNAQKMAQDLVEKQDNIINQLRKENEAMIKETVEKTVDEKLQTAGVELSEENVQNIQEEQENQEEFNEADNIELSEADEKYLIDEETPIATFESLDFLNTKEPISFDDDYPVTDESEKNVSSNDILDKIEKILSNPEAAKEYAEEIELFKKLRVLSKFLPENERNSFISCKMRVIIEYIISKMSGKPGLLITAESLLKSGVLGPEYESQLFNSDPAPVTDSLVVDVLLTMKELALGLEDKDLVNSLCVSVDCILEQIELENQKKEVF